LRVSNGKTKERERNGEAKFVVVASCQLSSFFDPSQPPPTPLLLCAFENFETEEQNNYIPRELTGQNLFLLFSLQFTMLKTNEKARESKILGA
jgi:hypothetical protein